MRVWIPAATPTDVEHTPSGAWRLRQDL